MREALIVRIFFKVLGAYRDYSNLDGKLRLNISDGKYANDCVILAFDNPGKWKQVVEYSIIRIKSYQHDEIKGKKFLIIDSYDILNTSITINLPNSGHTKTIGNPVPMDQSRIPEPTTMVECKSNPDLQVKLQNLEKVMVSLLENIVETLSDKFEMLSESARPVTKMKMVEDEDEMDEILRLKIENVKLNHQVEKLKLKVATSSSPKENGHKSDKAVKSAK